MKDRHWLNTIIKGDCLQVMPKLPPGSISCVLTDLPYGVTANTQWDTVLPFGELWAQWERLLKPNGCVVLTSMGAFTIRLCASKMSWFRYKWVWVKDQKVNCLNASRMPMRSHEDVCVFYRNTPTYNPQKMPSAAGRRPSKQPTKVSSYGLQTFGGPSVYGETYPNDILYIASAQSEGRVYHPTQKPLELGRYLVRTYTNPGDVVLDCTCGVGTFPLAAMLEGRNFVGIEIGGYDAKLRDKLGYDNYHEVAVERIKASVIELPRCVRLSLAQTGLLASQ